MGCPKIVPKGNLSEMVSNWQISIGYEDNQIMTHSTPFIALAICKAFWNLTALTSHAWCHGCYPVLVFPRGWSYFPMMDAGGSPFPHKEGASVDGGITIMAGTAGSGTACATDPTRGSTVWGPSSMGSASGNSGSPPGGMSSAPVSWHCRFLELLLSVCSAMSESEADSHSRHSHVV